MRTTITLDDKLLEKALALSHCKEKSALIAEALQAFIARESAKRLALLGGSEDALTPIPRRKTEPM